MGGLTDSYRLIVKEWADTANEEADAKPFLVEFFNVFGISSKRVSTFEHRVKKLDDKAVDMAYRPQVFTSEANKMLFLFLLYQKYTADQFTKKSEKKKKL